MNQDSYNVLSRFITCFTEDEEHTKTLLQENYEILVNDVASGKGGFLDDFTRMLKRAREIALQAVKDKPLATKCWDERKNFFPLSKAMSETHKEAFCLRFYRGLSEQEVSDTLRLTVEQTQIYLKQALHDVSLQSIIKIPEIATL